MPGTEQLRRRLLKKLSELFQLDQPDLDFGFYREEEFMKRMWDMEGPA